MNDDDDVDFVIDDDAQFTPQPTDEQLKAEQNVKLKYNKFYDADMEDDTHEKTYVNEIHDAHLDDLQALENQYNTLSYEPYQQNYESQLKAIENFDVDKSSDKIITFDSNIPTLDEAVEFHKSIQAPDDTATSAATIGSGLTLTSIAASLSQLASVDQIMDMTTVSQQVSKAMKQGVDKLDSTKPPVADVEYHKPSTDYHADYEPDVATRDERLKFGKTFRNIEKSNDKLDVAYKQKYNELTALEDSYSQITIKLKYNKDVKNDARIYNDLLQTQKDIDSQEASIKRELRDIQTKMQQRDSGKRFVDTAYNKHQRGLNKLHDKQAREKMKFYKTNDKRMRKKAADKLNILDKKIEREATRIASKFTRKEKKSFADTVRNIQQNRLQNHHLAADEMEKQLIQDKIRIQNYMSDMNTKYVGSINSVGARWSKIFAETVTKYVMKAAGYDWKPGDFSITFKKV